MNDRTYEQDSNGAGTQNVAGDAQQVTQSAVDRTLTFLDWREKFAGAIGDDGQALRAWNSARASAPSAVEFVNLRRDYDLLKRLCARAETSAAEAQVELARLRSAVLPEGTPGVPGRSPILAEVDKHAQDDAGTPASGTAIAERLQSTPLPNGRRALAGPAAEALTPGGAAHAVCVERLLVDLHNEDRLSEGQCAKLLGVDRITWRKIADEAALARPAAVLADKWHDERAAFTSALILAIGELPDRTSLSDEPGSMVANSDEIASCVGTALERTGLRVASASRATLKESTRSTRALRLLEIAEPILEATAAGKRVTIAAGDLLRELRVFLADDEWEQACAPDWQNLCALLRAKHTIYDGLNPIKSLQPPELQLEAADLIGSVFTRASLLDVDGPGDWRKKAGYVTEDGNWTVFGASWIPTYWARMPDDPPAPDAAQGGTYSTRTSERQPHADSRAVDAPVATQQPRTGTAPAHASAPSLSRTVALAAIDEFEIVGDSNNSRAPTDDERFVLREFIAYLFENSQTLYADHAASEPRAEKEGHVCNGRGERPALDRAVAALPSPTDVERADREMRESYEVQMGEIWATALQARRHIWSLAWGASRAAAGQSALTKETAGRQEESEA